MMGVADRPERQDRPATRRPDRQRQLRVRHHQPRTLVPGDGTPRNDLGLAAVRRRCPTAQTEDLVPGDYIVAVDIPKNPVGGGDDVQGDQRGGRQRLRRRQLPAAGELRPITPADGRRRAARRRQRPAARRPSRRRSRPASSRPAPARCTRCDVTDQPFLDGGGSPFEGQDRPSCDAKLVTVRGGQTTAPNFNLFTDVPIPTHFWGLTINDLGLTLDKRSVNYGEAQGLPYVPWASTTGPAGCVDTTHTDFNGFYEALEPSTGTFNCPVPAGPCPNMYRFTGNDPGQPGHPNADYNPRFRTICDELPGLAGSLHGHRHGARPRWPPPR